MVESGLAEEAAELMPEPGVVSRETMVSVTSMSMEGLKEGNVTALSGAVLADIDSVSLELGSALEVAKAETEVAEVMVSVSGRDEGRSDAGIFSEEGALDSGLVKR